MLHHSCARCREKKIRCDGKTPCNHCISCEVQGECKRLQRKQRSRKASRPVITTALKHNGTTMARGSGVVDASPSGSSYDNLGGVSGSTATNGKSNVVVSTPQSSLRPPPSSVSEHSDSPSAIFDFNGLHHRCGSSTAFSPSSTSNITTTSSSISQSLLSDDSLSLIEKARHVIGDHDAAQLVIDMQYHYRCSSIVGACVHVPSLKRTLSRLYYCPSTSSSSAESVGEAELAVLLMSLAMSIQFTPRGASERSQLPIIDALGPNFSPTERQNALHSLAKSILQRLVFSSDATLAQVQACILIVVYDLDESGFKEGMLWNAVRCAERLKMDHIGSAEEVTVENEMRVRAWWFLATRDWFMAPRKGSYRINPAHFTTRLPLVVRDEELEQLPLGSTVSEVLQENRSELWLPVRIMLPLIELASLVRTLVDEKLSLGGLSFDKVEQSFVALMERLPVGYRLDETYTYGVSTAWPPSAYQQRYSIERWILHQIVFATMLEFYDVPQRIGEPVSPTMLALANHILDLQSRLRHHCDVVDTLKVNVDGVVRAAILICTDLMYRSSMALGEEGGNGRGGNGLVRQLTLGRVREAVLRCQTSRSVKGDLGIIEGLLEAEERCWRQRSGGNTMGNNATYIPNLMQQASPSSAPLTPAPPHGMRSTAASLTMMGSTAIAFDEIGRSVSDGLSLTGESDDVVRLVPSDAGICPALQTDSDVMDRLWEGVMAFLDKPIATADHIS